MDTVELRFKIHSFLVVSQSDTTTFVNLPVLEPIEWYKKDGINYINKENYICMYDDRRMGQLMVYMKEQLIELRDVFVEWTINK